LGAANTISYFNLKHKTTGKLKEIKVNRTEPGGGGGGGEGVGGMLHVKLIFNFVFKLN
jgi:hypothetical protein